MSVDNPIPLEILVGELLTKHEQTLTVAESCTGGLITHLLTNVAGSSGYFIGGVTAYAYEAKVALLGVEWDTLNRYGAVSEETARAMARGVRGRLSSTLGLAVTGIAGPGGGTLDKPVGLTYICLADAAGETVERHVWTGERVQIKQASARAALELVVNYLQHL